MPEVSLDGLAMGGDRWVNLSAGDAAFPFETLGKHVFEESMSDLHRYYVSDLTCSGIPTPIETVEKIVPYLVRRNFLPSMGMFPQRLLTRMLILGGGTTEGFEHVLRLMVRDVQQQNANSDHPVDPVILMPVPTYGYFLKQAETCGLPYVTIQRRMHEGGVLASEDVRAAFESLDAQGKRVVGFYDCNPHNPTGLIRDRQQTDALAEVFREINEIYESRNLAEARVTPDNPDGVPWRGPASRLRIIDDLVYDGLEFPGETPGASFAELEDTREDVILLLGLSKLGLAGLRAGLMVASQQFIRGAYDLQIATSYFPNQPAIRAIENYYRDEQPFEGWRTDHLKSLTETHAFRGKFMKALINGLEGTEDVSDTDKSAMIAALVRHKDITPDAAIARMSRPIGRVRIATNPKSGFFHLLDFSALKGTMFRSKSGEEFGPVDDEAVLREILHAEQFHLCFGIWTGLSKDAMLERVTFALDVGLIIDAADRLEALIAQFSPYPESMADNVEGEIDRDPSRSAVPQQ